VRVERILINPTTWNRPRYIYSFIWNFNINIYVDINQIKKDRSIIHAIPSTRYVYIYRMKCPLMYSKAQRIQEILYRIITMRAPRHLLKINRSKFTEEKKTTTTTRTLIASYMLLLIDSIYARKKRRTWHMKRTKNRINNILARYARTQCPSRTFCLFRARVINPTYCHILQVALLLLLWSGTS
jgi:hypothetical protein